jgi:mannose-6-phosphate isomerase-like protein (cupin superfamily)
METHHEKRQDRGQRCRELRRPYDRDHRIAGDDGEDTVMTVTPKFGARPHISYDEDKTFLVSAGALRFTVQDSTFDAHAGECVTVKRGDVHGS